MSSGHTHSYIVGCPRVACPFDDEQQAQPYPAAEIGTAMAQLADRLLGIAGRAQRRLQALALYMHTHAHTRTHTHTHTYTSTHAHMRARGCTYTCTRH